MINYFNDFPEMNRMDNGESIEAEVYISNFYLSGYLVRGRLVFNYAEQLIAVKCSQCNKFFTVDDYYSKPDTRYGLKSNCRNCESHRKHKYFIKNYCDIVKRHKVYRSLNEDKLSEQVRIRKERETKSYDRQYMQKFLSEKRVCAITGIESRKNCIEHINPLSMSDWGSSLGNIMWLIKPLNSSKSDGNVFEWIDRMTQDKLDFLLRKYNYHIELAAFKERYYEVLTEKAAERGLTLAEYKTEYNKSYYKQ